MFQNRNIIVLAIAAILGIAAVIIANAYLSGLDESKQRAVEQNRLVQIAVARVPLKYGTTLTSENIRMVSWPATALPQGAFRSAKELINGKPHAVLRPLEAGEPILPGKITGPGGRASLSELIETDMRALAVRISDTAGVGGHVLPGNSVDVLLTRTPKMDGERGELDPITDVLLQNVRVAAIDLNPSDRAGKPKVGKTATLIVNQQDAQKLVLADRVGSLSLILRNTVNQDQFAAATVGTRDLGPGDLSSSLYAGEAKRNSSSYASIMPPAYSPPVATGRAAPAGAVSKAPRVPRVPNGVTVEVVRGTKTTPYDVRRHRGY
jgi:pilus assembly protein CpaB